MNPDRVSGLDGSGVIEGGLQTPGLTAAPIASGGTRGGNVKLATIRYNGFNNKEDKGKS